MSLFQCEKCGCCENTALSAQGFHWTADLFDWTYAPELEGKRLCSACGPMLYRDGTPTKFGKWHDVFERTFLPLGMFCTNERGNLSHVETGSEDYHQFAIQSVDP